MNRCGELMALFLQETEETEQRNKTTIVDLLTETTMNSVTGDQLRRRRSLHQRLRFNPILCCGSSWRFGSSAINTQPESDSNNENENQNENDVVESVHHQHQYQHHHQHQQTDAINLRPADQNPDVNSDPECSVQSPRMNLAAALAAEREFRAGGDEAEAEEEGRPMKMSLMRLLEEGEMDGQDEEMGRDQVCCVCMGRKKGGALIPCGHTYCRVCCRELWLKRGSCPLCNRSILEILDIY